MNSTETDDDARRARAGGDRPAERRTTTPKLEGNKQQRADLRPEVGIFRNVKTWMRVSRHAFIDAWVD